MIYIICVLVAILLGLLGFSLFLFNRLKNFKEKNNILDSANKMNESRIESLQNHIDELHLENKKLLEERATLNTSLAYEKQINEDRIREYKSLSERSKNEFKLLSNDILDEKIKLAKHAQEENLATILKPLQSQIESFKKQVEEINKNDIRDRTSLVSEIKHLKDLNIKISQDALNLTNALRGNNKTQGNWGEMILERLLEDSGLIKDREYTLQQSYKNNDGGMLRPDVIINLPNDKKIIIDSKVSLLDYERFINNGDNESLNIHIISLKNHIKELSKKNYEGILNGSSLDFVLMFIPIEGAFLEALRHDSELFSFAYNKNIILVSPTTLLATLRTIGNIWRNERQSENMQEILDVASGLYDKFNLFYENMQSLGEQITRLDSTYHKSLNQLKDGRGSMYSKIQKLEELGVKVKAKLPNLQ